MSSIDRPYAYGNYSGNFREFWRQTIRIQEPVWALSELQRTGTPIWVSVSSTEQELQSECQWAPQNRNSNLSVSEVYRSSTEQELQSERQWALQKLHRTGTPIWASVSSTEAPQNRNSNLRVSKLYRTGTPIWASVSSTEAPQNRNSKLSVSEFYYGIWQTVHIHEPEPERQQALQTIRTQGPV